MTTPDSEWSMHLILNNDYTLFSMMNTLDFIKRTTLDLDEVITLDFINASTLDFGNMYTLDFKQWLHLIVLR